MIRRRGSLLPARRVVFGGGGVGDENDAHVAGRERGVSRTGEQSFFVFRVDQTGHFDWSRRCDRWETKRNRREASPDCHPVSCRSCDPTSVEAYPQTDGECERRSHARICHKLRVCSLASEENPALSDAQRGCCAMLAPPENAVRRGKIRDLASITAMAPVRCALCSAHRAIRTSAVVGKIPNCLRRRSGVSRAQATRKPPEEFSRGLVALLADAGRERTAGGNAAPKWRPGGARRQRINTSAGFRE